MATRLPRSLADASARGGSPSDISRHTVDNLHCAARIGLAPYSYTTTPVLRTFALLAGLIAALAIGGLLAGRSDAVPNATQTAWVEQHVEDIAPGQAYRLEGCLTVTAPGVNYLALRVTWYAEPGGFGSAIYQKDAAADPWRLGAEQCLTLAGAEAPCSAHSVRYGVILSGDPSAVEVSSLSFAPDPEGTPFPCPTPIPTATPTATPAPSPAPAPTPTPSPAPSSPAAPARVAEAAEEPVAFSSLTNGAFERTREDGSPYAWRKVGGEMSTSSTVRAEGSRSASLTSRTESTKWIYQTVSIEGGAYYRLQAQALKNDPAAREVLLRVSWYTSEDGSGSQIDTADSPSTAADAAAFVALDTGPIQAPVEARSAKVRLMLRPMSSAPTTVYFDDARFAETAAPPELDGDGSGDHEGVSATEDHPPTVPAGAAMADAGIAMVGAQTGPAPLSNVRPQREDGTVTAGGGSRPLWPILLAIGASAAALALVAGQAWLERKPLGQDNHEE